MSRSTPARRLPSFTVFRRERFFAGYWWVILRNLIGWVLILLSFVAGPLVPGPGGLPLFLIGFALITFPGKRRLTARVLRGRAIRFPTKWKLLTLLGVSLLVPAVGLAVFARFESIAPAYPRGTLALLEVWVAGVAVMWLISCGAMFSVNLILGIMPPLRRHVRPWLRRHRIRLLPPRRRRRLHHEPGVGALRLKDEILSFIRRRHEPTHDAQRPNPCNNQ